MRTYLLWRYINVYLTSFHFILILSCHVYFDDLLYMKHTCEQKNDKIGLKFSICQLKNEYPAIHFKLFEKKTCIRRKILHGFAFKFGSEFAATFFKAFVNLDLTRLE
jgi:hypothetical protein